MRMLYVTMEAFMNHQTVPATTERYTLPTKMQVWAVTYSPLSITEDLYQRGLHAIDDDSAARIKRFYHRADACRTLIGRLLARALLLDRGISPKAMTFAATESGKPYITTTGLDPPIGYNVTHDNALVAIAFAPGAHQPPAFSIGVDIMKVRVPARSTFASFVQTMADQLTPLERRLVFAGTSQDENLRRFFWMWTLKEAYTKALGLGLGFDFRRVEFDVESNTVRVDGAIPKGWYFSKFIVEDGEDVYEGVVAQFLGGEETVVLSEADNHEWLHIFEAGSFVESTIERLTVRQNVPVISNTV
ncbi:4'-phosphopantetheinyl transferase superfamily [Infundibulicybe gibba]|nr:4'-phosphopantetheinyl transferase superfamily [Infundibulicybe gibba]